MTFVTDAAEGPLPTVNDMVKTDIDEIKERQLLGMGLVIGGVASLVAWWMLPRADFRLDAFWVYMVLIIAGLMMAVLRYYVPGLARVALLVGPSASLHLALGAFSSPVVPCFGALAVVANASVSPSLGVASAALSTIPILLAGGPPEAMIPSLAMIWLAAALMYISSRSLYMALNWAWESEERALRLLGELRSRQRELNGTVSALTEATRRLQRTRHELATSRAIAEEGRQLKERFAANISHELRTPLNLILGFSEMMHRSPDIYGDIEWPPTLRRDVRQIYRSSRHLLHLINDVLDLSRVDAAQMRIYRETTDLCTVLRDGAASMRELIERQGLRLITDIPHELQLSIDPTRIRQVLLNLLNNAVRFTQEGSISVSVIEREKDVIVRIADTGTGISVDKVGSIFEEFHQVDMSRSRATGGAGLGLAISRSFVELHGGNIWVESALGEGSTFSFTLPREDVASTSLTRTRRLAQNQALGPCRAGARVLPLGPLHCFAQQHASQVTLSAAQIAVDLSRRDSQFVGHLINSHPLYIVQVEHAIGARPGSAQLYARAGIHLVDAADHGVAQSAHLLARRKTHAEREGHR